MYFYGDFCMCPGGRLSEIEWRCSQSAEVLRWESPASPVTPLPQDDKRGRNPQRPLSR
jgi:hypothetical protein